MEIFPLYVQNLTPHKLKARVYAEVLSEVELEERGHTRKVDLPKVLKIEITILPREAEDE